MSKINVKKVKSFLLACLLLIFLFIALRVAYDCYAYNNFIGHEQKNETSQNIQSKAQYCAFFLLIKKLSRKD